METSGPDQKRPRIHYDAQQRMPQVHHQSNHALPPPQPHQQAVLSGPMQYSANPPHNLQQPPPSPFNDVNQDGRNLPDPHSYVQQHPQSGQTTPRDGRFQPDVDMQRRGSTGAFSRSPPSDQYPQYAPHRPPSIVTTGDPGNHPAQYTIDSSGQMSAFPPPEAHVNGNIQTHGLPIHPHDQVAPSMGPGFAEGYGPSPVTAGPPHYAGMPYGPAMGPGGIRTKKGNRATQACDNCRTRKAKCDEGRPQCGFCAESELPCKYQSIAPAKMDRANAAIMEQLDIHQKDIKALKDGNSELNHKLDRTEEKLDRIERLLLHKSGAATDDSNIKNERGNRSPPKSVLGGPKPSTGAAKEQKMNDESPSTSFHASSDSGGPESMPSVAKQDATHIEHDTAAQKLFRWPAIKALLQKCKHLNFSENTERYVLELELKKGLLHLYGRGRGQEEVDANTMGLSAYSPASSSNGIPTDGMSEGSSPASSTDLPWGHGLYPFVGEGSKESVIGGSCSDNTLKLDPKTISLLHQSYMQNIQIMHPILDEAVLTKVIETFKRRYGGLSEASSAKTPFAVPAPTSNIDVFRESSGPFSKPMKRKHSDGPYFADTGASHVPQPRSMLERSPNTALVLLVMALGKVCECREPLSGPVSSKDSTTSSTAAYSPAFQTDSPPPYPVRQSPSTYSATASPVGIGRPNHLSPRSSVGDLPSKQVKNFDVIPGLAYYAQATDILGNLTGSLDITYVQCCLLAGLFAGQLASSVESLTWIQNASRVCCVLCRDPTLSSYSKPRQNSIRFAFYTALQLESDILAEIDFEPSGIQKIQNVDYPSGFCPDDEQPTEEDMPRKNIVMQYYSYQLHLRKILNNIQKDLYPADTSVAKNYLRKNKTLRDIYHDWLAIDWRNKVLPDINWTDDDSIPHGINNARLRGKYYGALYIIHRPMIHYALELEAKGDLDEYMTALLAPNDPGPMGPPKAPAKSYLTDVMDSASIAIKAAIRSTTAFDNAMDRKRLIVTNILGTAHAQFGNMLVLSAVYKSKYLKHFIGERPKITMQHLFKRTISFLGEHAAISATLQYDCSILKWLREVVFEGEDDHMIEPMSSSSLL